LEMIFAICENQTWIFAENRRKTLLPSFPFHAKIIARRRTRRRLRKK